MCDIKEGDTVVVKRTVKENKLSTTFAPEEYTVTKLVGSNATVQSNTSGRILQRNVAHLKPLSTSESVVVPADVSTEAPSRDLFPSTQDNETENETEDRSSEIQEYNSINRSTRMSRKPEYLKDYDTNAVCTI